MTTQLTSLNALIEEVGEELILHMPRQFFDLEGQVEGVVLDEEWARLIAFALACDRPHMTQNFLSAWPGHIARHGAAAAIAGRFFIGDEWRCARHTAAIHALVGGQEGSGDMRCLDR